MEFKSLAEKKRETIRLENNVPGPDLPIPILEGIQGVYAGREIRVLFNEAGEIQHFLGTDAGFCEIPFPPDTPGVDRIQLQAAYYYGSMIIMDMDSRQGTWLNGKRLTPRVVYRPKPGDILAFGDQRFRVAEL